MNPYAEYVHEIRALRKCAEAYPLPAIEPPANPPAPDAPVVLVCSPHPDDECILGALPLRLMRELGMRAVNLAVTLGSKPERRNGRWEELTNACAYLGFELIAARPGGFERINPGTRQSDPAYWEGAVADTARVIADLQPKLLMFPHVRDWNSTHEGVHHLVMDALASLGGGLSPYLAETEFWHQMDEPNLLVEADETTLADLIAATAFHVGEVSRNPYHLLLPAIHQDGVRRGAERVGIQGGAAPDFDFGILHRFRRWENGAPREVLEGGLFLPAGGGLEQLFNR